MPSPVRIASILAGLVPLGAAAQAPAGEPAVTLKPALVEGDTVPGVGAVSRVDRLAVNRDGSWMVEADTDNADTFSDTVIIREGGLFVREDDGLALPVGARIDTFGFATLTDVGDVAWSLSLAGSSATQGLFLGTGLVLRNSALYDADGFFSPTTALHAVRLSTMSANRTLLAALVVRDPDIPGLDDSALVLLSLDALGAIVSTQVVAVDGTKSPGAAAPMSDTSAPAHSIAVNAAGRTLAAIELEAPADSNIAVLLDGSAVIQEGDASPIPGHNWGPHDPNTRVALHACGSWIVSAFVTDGATTTPVLVLDGAVFKQAGDDVSTPGGVFQITRFGTSSVAAPVYLTDGGAPVWFGEWSDPDLSRNTGLFVGERLIVQKGVTEVGGEPIVLLRAADNTFAAAGRHILFEGVLPGDVEGAFLATLAPTPEGDANGDCVVDTADLGLLLSGFGESGSDPADLNGDCSIDTADVGLLLAHFGEVCAP